MFEEDFNDDITLSDIKEAVMRKGKWYFVLLTVILALSVSLIYLGVHDDRDDSMVYESDEASEDDEKPDAVTVDLSGAVNKPGVYKLSKGSRLVDLLELGDGFVSDVSGEWVSKSLNLSDVLQDSQKVYIPFVWELSSNNKLSLTLETLDEEISYDSEVLVQQQITLVGEDEESDTKINVNAASQSELESLQGIGKAYAQRIIDNRPYSDLTVLQEKTGIPQSTLDKIAELITF